MSISRDGNSLFDRARHVGTLATGVNNSMTIKFIHGLRLEKQRLLEIAYFIEPMTHQPFERSQTAAPASIPEEPHRPRIILQPGTNDLFRAVGGIVEYANPVGSIEDGFFEPAPGVDFGHKELIDIAGHLAQKAYAAKA